MNKSKTQQISNGGSGSRRAEGSRPGARGRSMRISSVETMVSLEPASSLTASPNLGHWRRSMALRERRALASLRTRVVMMTLTLLPSSSTILYSHLWLHRICYSFILTLKSICMVRSRHHPSLEIHFQGRMTTLRAHKNIFLFYSKSLFKSLYIEE